MESEDEKIKRGSDNASQADFPVYTSSFNFFLAPTWGKKQLPSTAETAPLRLWNFFHVSSFYVSSRPPSPADQNAAFAVQLLNLSLFYHEPPLLRYVRWLPVSSQIKVELLTLKRSYFSGPSSLISLFDEMLPTPLWPILSHAW